MAHDQQIIKQLQQRFQNWNPNRPCPIPHVPQSPHCCVYDEQGRLIQLHLCGLRLMQVPSEVWRCLSLQRLDLGNNQLSTLPVDVGQLSSLQWLYLGGPPLQSPPREIIAQGIPAILAYLRTLQQAKVERFEAKVILVGEGGMGKTSLLRRLQGQDFVETLLPTQGIEIVPLSAPHPLRSHQQITLYTWDFGGQEIYQATHQFFLTQRSVYLLVWNARLGVEACRLPFWLNTIKGHAPDAKILLVATHSDLWNTPTINLSSYQQRYPQIVGLCTISNRTTDGFDDLKAQLLAAVLQTPFVGQQWPRTWVEAEKELLARPEHHIDAATFTLVCRQHQIESERERKTFGRYLHDLGKILYFHDDPMLNTMEEKEGYEVRQGKEWWNTMSPWLRRIVKVLEVGIPLGKTINEGFKLVDIERFAPEIEVLNEILGDLPEISAIDALSNAQLDEKKVQVIQHLEGAALEALYTFLQGHPRPWQGLSQVITNDGTILWLCERHRQEFETPLITVI